MAIEELEVTIEIHCVDLPGARWGDRGPVHLGIQQGDELVAAASADLERIVFRPALRVRRHTDGSANFLGPFAQGSRAERFIYLVWAAVETGTRVAMLGRVKIHLNHVKWAHVAAAVARRRPIKVTIPLTNAKGKPVFASVRSDASRWEF
jgi:hypothetical protein